MEHKFTVIEKGKYILLKNYTMRGNISIATIPAGTVLNITQIDNQYHIEIMKPISKETLENGTIVITTEKSFFFGLIKKQTKYSSNRIIAGKFRSWLKEPNKLIVPNKISFQLDEWCDVL